MRRYEPSDLLRIALLAVAYYVAGRIVLAVSLVPGVTPLLWLPTGIGIASIVLYGFRVWPVLAASDLLIGASVGMPVPVAFGTATGDVLEMAIAAHLLRRVFHFDPTLARLREVVALVLAAGTGAVVGATVGVTSLTLGGVVPELIFPDSWLVWWIGDIVGALVAAPAILVWSRRPAVRERPGYWTEFAVYLALLSAVAYFVFHWHVEVVAYRYPLAYALFPLVMVAAFRLEQRGVATASVVVSGFAAAHALASSDGLSQLVAIQRSLFLQGLLGAIVLTGLVLGALTVERRRGVARERELRHLAQEEERHARFLAESSEILASSLDYRETLGAVARLAVRTIADWCTVDVVEDGRLARMAAAHADPARADLMLRFQRRFPPGWLQEAPAARAVRSEAPVLLSDLSGATLAADVSGPEHLRILSELGARSAIAAPLVARGHTLGAISLVSAEEPFDEDDVALAQQLARRAAIAIDNARLYQEARAASKAKSDFLAVMSHELRTPLNAIVGYADLLELEIAGPLTAEQKKQLTRVKACAEHQLQIIEEILTFARMDTGRETVHTSRVALGELVRDVADFARPMAQAKGLDFRAEAPGTPTEIETDPSKVRHILLNLLSNAVKFTDEGRVELEAEASDGAVRFRVRDTGVGIAPEDRERIFTPFTQVEEALTRERGGTGLGLTVARQLARMLGGDVTVESAPGAGSTFSVRLPARPAPDGGRGPSARRRA